jgi:hypothetical protein
LAIELVPRIVPDVGGLFFLGPHEAQETQIPEGRANALRLKGPSDLPLHKQKMGERIATGEIRFRSLGHGWEYSPELSTERTLYYQIIDHRVELVPASQGRHWKIR